jgi:hypothetical protein
MLSSRHHIPLLVLTMTTDTKALIYEDKREESEE